MTKETKLNLATVNNAPQAQRGVGIIHSFNEFQNKTVDGMDKFHTISALTSTVIA